MSPWDIILPYPGVGRTRNGWRGRRPATASRDEQASVEPDQAARSRSSRLTASQCGTTRRPQSPGLRTVHWRLAMLAYGTQTSLPFTRQRSPRPLLLMASTSWKVTKSCVCMSPPSFTGAPLLPSRCNGDASSSRRVAGLARKLARCRPIPRACRRYNPTLPYAPFFSANGVRTADGGVAAADTGDFSRWHGTCSRTQTRPWAGGTPMKDDEQLSTLLEPDVMLPEQFFAGPRRNEERGEHRLMAAILDDAVQTYCMPQVARARGGWRAEREAGEWIESADRSWVFSFERICEALDLDAACIRRGVRTWKQRSGRRRGVVIDFRPRSRPDDNDEAALEIALRTALHRELVPAPMRGAGGARGTTAGS